MRITLTVVDGPGKGQEFTFDRHDTFLVGRSSHAHFKLPGKDKFVSRIHFMMEVNPPCCRLIDLNSHNGTFVNGAKVLTADLHDGAQIRAGHTTMALALVADEHDRGEPFSSVDRPNPLAQPSPGLASPPALPRELAGYQVVQVVGQGNMGATCLVKRLRDGHSFSMKVIIPPVEGTMAQARLFLREAQVLGTLQHPHIVRLHEIGEGGGLLFFVHDWIPGLNAAQVLQKDGVLHPIRAIRWADQALQALEYAHAQGKVHRDIKPNNLLVQQGVGPEKVLLSDFGLAHVYQQSQLSGLAMGQGDNIAFWPMEQITNFGQAHPTGDQYSLAATLYYLLTGKTVVDFPREVSRQVSQLLEKKPVPIRERRQDVPAGLAAALDRALSQNPQQRFPNAGAFRQAILATG